MTKNIERRMCELYLENCALKEENDCLKESMREINGILYSVGGPLNDNVMKYSQKQLKTFFNIGQYVRL